MKNVNIWNICITQWNNDQCMHKIVKVQVIPIELNLSIKNSLITVSILHCNKTLKNYHLTDFGTASLKNIHNYLKRY